MPRRPSTKSPASARNWQRRVGSAAFARELTALVKAELEWIAKQKFKDVVDARLVHELIDRADDLLAIDAVSALLGTLRATARRHARQTKHSLHAILGDELVGEIDTALGEMTNLTGQFERFIDEMMERELVQSLMTDLVYTAIVSFNRKVNPLGNLALLAMDTQVKSFIRMLMPMLQRQATAFLVDRKNRALFADFARAAARQVLNEPVAQLSALFDQTSDEEAEALIKKTARNSHVRRLARDSARLLVDAALAHLNRRRIGDILLLDDNLDWLAQRIAEPLLALLARPHVAAFVEREITVATTPVERVEGGAPRRRRT